MVSINCKICGGLNFYEICQMLDDDKLDICTDCWIKDKQITKQPKGKDD